MPRRQEASSPRQYLGASIRLARHQSANAALLRQISRVSLEGWRTERKALSRASRLRVRKRSQRSAVEIKHASGPPSAQSRLRISASFPSGREALSTSEDRCAMPDLLSTITGRRPRPCASRAIASAVIEPPKMTRRIAPRGGVRPGRSRPALECAYASPPSVARSSSATIVKGDDMFESLPLPQNDGASFTDGYSGGARIGEVHLIGNEVGTRVHDGQQLARPDEGQIDRVKQNITQMAERPEYVVGFRRGEAELGRRLHFVMLVARGKRDVLAAIGDHRVVGAGTGLDGEDAKQQGLGAAGDRPARLENDRRSSAFCRRVIPADQIAHRLRKCVNRRMGSYVEHRGRKAVGHETRIGYRIRLDG